MSSLLGKRDGHNEIDEQVSVKQQKISSNVSLNYDVLIHLFGFFDQQTLCAAAMVCKDWKMAAYCPLLWKNAVFTLDHNALNDQSVRSLGKRGIKKVKANVTDEDTESFGQALVTCAEVMRCETLLVYDHLSINQRQCILARFPRSFSSLKHLALVTPRLMGCVEELMSPLVNLEQLYIEWADEHFSLLEEYDADFIRPLSTSLPKLKDLELVNDQYLVAYDHTLDDDSLENTLVFPKLEKLVVDTDRSIDVMLGFMNIPVHFPGLKHLALPTGNFHETDFDLDDDAGLVPFQSLESLNLGSEACAALLPHSFINIFESSLNLKAVDLSVSAPYYGLELEDKHFKAIIEALPNLSVLIYGHEVSFECINGLMPKMKDLVMLASVGEDTVNENAVKEFLTNIQTHMHKLTSLLDIGVDLTDYLDRLSNVRYICHPDCSDWSDGIWKRLDANQHTYQQGSVWEEVREGSGDWHEAVCTSWFTLPGSFDFRLMEDSPDSSSTHSSSPDGYDSSDW